MPSDSSSKLQIAVLFGGQSIEHEISILTALQVMDAMDSTRYDIIPVYVDPNGDWYTGQALRKRDTYWLTDESKKSLTQVVLQSNNLLELVEAHPKKGFFGYKEAQRIPVDLFFPAFHGSFGEDGCVQGMLEWVNAPYTGCGPLAASLGMNKYRCKRFLKAVGNTVLPGILLERQDWDAEKADETAREVLTAIELPLMVKPCNLGSSLGASVARTEEELMISIAGAFGFDYQVLIEPLLEDMYELNISVMEGSPPLCSAIERPTSDEKVLTFEQKYLKGSNKGKTSLSEGMASMKRDLNPKNVPQEILDEVIQQAVSAFTAMGCKGLVRFDFMVNNEDQTVYFNEVNILPGSFSYYLWENAEPKIPFTQLITKLIDAALEEHRYKRKIKRSIQPRIFT
jgi:D-alanine-D-alanine ligase